ncbi:hypothetical protein SYNPS1DRAFT_20874, partial [Syncephalis pseudoplumigaleata]
MASAKDKPVKPTVAEAAPAPAATTWAQLAKKNIKQTQPSAAGTGTANYTLSFHVPLIQPRGMLNSNNTCYMNAILQPLAHCPPFYNLFNTIGQRVAFSFNSETPLVESMVMFVKEFQELAAIKELDPFTPEYVYETLRQLKKFDSLRGRQEDADEFLGSLLDTLHEEFDQARRKHQEAMEKQQNGTKSGRHEADGDDTWLEVGKKQKTCQTRTMDMNESPISRMFWGKIRSVVKRPGSRDSATLEPFRSLHLDISSPHIHSVEDALLQLAAIEELDISTSTHAHENQLQDLPPMLVLHIKRFHYDPELGTQKLRRRIAYEMMAPSRRDKPPTYLLVGVVYHHGQYTAGGHYTCDVRRQDGQWIRINDTVIEPISESDVCVGAATPSSSMGAAEVPSLVHGQGEWDGWSRTTEGDAYLLFYMDASLYT